MRAVGGGTRNEWWQQLKADVLGVPIETLAVSDVTAQGAALVAGMAIGMFTDAKDAARRAYRPVVRYEPNSENHARYDALYHNTFEKLGSVLVGGEEKNITLEGQSQVHRRGINRNK
jgi:sugar (pentulose or hexulose) kinase